MLQLFKNVSDAVKRFVAIFLFAVLAACGMGASSLAPENLSDQNWKNGIWVQKDGGNGFFVKGSPEDIKVVASTKLVFAKSGERVVTKVVVSGPYINIFVDKPLDPEGDGYPNKIAVVK